ncbi:hypothetical protein [Streptococcus sp. DD13]|uniref:hypothetical protein n=1 Tax=Streptococcus sp. DD13 TaxID=1777881 RepID=UPI000794E64A|nr:hypothetical protein [Streptococcus sp. DD13]KXT78291.1 hypothetical protein STRDD13_00850 [Streptococcus sp. DD13]
MYEDYPIKPYISPERDLTSERGKSVPRRNMEPLSDGLLAGDILLLWRVSFGTFHNQSWFPKYFEYTYGIHAEKHLQDLIQRGYVYEETAFESRDHLNARDKKAILQSIGVKGLSKLTSQELDQALLHHFSEEELGKHFEIRGFALTEKGRQTLSSYQAVIDRHPKKTF